VVEENFLLDATPLLSTAPPPPEEAVTLPEDGEEIEVTVR